MTGLGSDKKNDCESVLRMVLVYGVLPFLKTSTTPTSVSINISLSSSLRGSIGDKGKVLQVSRKSSSIGRQGAFSTSATNADGDDLEGINMLE